MRRVLVAIVSLTACGNGSSTSRAELAPAPPLARLEGGVDETASMMHIHYAGRRVPLADLPIAARLSGIPMSGDADIAIDLTVPKEAGRTNFTGATGEIDVSCPRGCRIGDDVAKIRFDDPNVRAFAGDAIDFGHLLLDGARVSIAVADGTAKVTRWDVDSKDITLKASGTIELARDFMDSTIEACIAFAGTDTLLHAQPKTYALLAVTGAMVGSEGLYHIRVTGRLADAKRLPQDCTP